MKKKYRKAAWARVEVARAQAAQAEKDWRGLAGPCGPGGGGVSRGVLGLGVGKMKHGQDKAG